MDRKTITRNLKDALWLERFHRLTEKKIDRIVTIVYLTLVKIDRRFRQLSDKQRCLLDTCGRRVKSLAFRPFPDFAGCITIRHYVEYVSVMFDGFPGSLRRPICGLSYQLIYDKVFDVRNFHKKIALMPCSTLERKTGRCMPRAARFYKFDRSIYNKSGTKFTRHNNLVGDCWEYCPGRSGIGICLILHRPFLEG